jgi:hypothetical protein
MSVTYAMKGNDRVQGIPYIESERAKKALILFGGTGQTNKVRS